MSKKNEKTFEERIARLEEIAQNLRGPDLDLNEAMAQFEEGIHLAKGLEKELAEMDKKVELLINGPGALANQETKPEFRDGDLFES